MLDRRQVLKGLVVTGLAATALKGLLPGQLRAAAIKPGDSSALLVIEVDFG